MNFFSIDEPLPDFKDEPLEGIKDEPLPDIKDEIIPVIKDEPLPEIKAENVVSIKCDVCFKRYSTYGNLRKHRKNAHNISFFKKKGIKLYNCPNCDKTFKSKSNYNTHMTIYSNIKYTCNQCEHTYENKRSFARHKKMHDNPETTSCNKCDKILSTKEGLQRHMQSFHSEKNKTDKIQSNGIYTCNTCGSAYSSMSNLNKHIRKHHEDPLYHSQEVIGKIKCDQCNRSYFKRGNLNKHKKNDHGMKHICKNCNLEFTGKRTLRKHIIVVHNKNIESKKRKVDGDEQISDCSKERKVNEVVNEISEVYDSIKTKVENNVVKSNEELLDQKITEDPITLHSTASNLNKHFRKHHENHIDRNGDISQEVIGKIQCDQCKKPYFSRRNLNKHLKIAHGMRHVCKQCNLEFDRKSSLRIHISVAHYKNYERKKRKVDGDEQISEGSKERKVNEVVNEISEVYDSIQEKVEDNLVQSNEELLDEKITKDPIMLHSTIINLNKHLRKHNEDHSDYNDDISQEVIGKIKCDQCNKSYFSRGNLNKHKTKAQCNGDKGQEVIGKIKCDQCNKAYFLRGNLNKHKRIAHGMKHVCEHCNLEFTRKRSLRIHILVDHYKQDESEIRKVYGDGQITEGSKQRKVNKVVNELSEVYDSIKEKVESNVVKSNNELLDKEIIEDPMSYDWDLMLLNFLVFMADAR